MNDDIFLEKMKGVKPLKKNNKNNNNNNKKISQINTTKNKKTKTKNTPLKKDFKETGAISEFKISFGDINKDLKKGKIKIDRRLDLHGFTLVEAYNKFKNEVVKSYTNNKRCLLVITGKGAYIKKSNNQETQTENPKLYYGKIKNAITEWAQEKSLSSYILTYQDASIEHGGDGAIFIYLRKKRN